MDLSSCNNLKVKKTQEDEGEIVLTFSNFF